MHSAGTMTDQQSRAHIDRFNAGVTTGDWAAFVAGFAPDAVMTFEGPPVGPFIGRDAIAEGYAAGPPDDTMQITSVHSAGDTDKVAFRWSRGGTGTMTIRRRGDLITGLAVAFD
jgi:steroid Delta-isomerase